MSWLKQLFSRCRLYGDLSEEIREHLEEKIEELVAGGMSRREATYAARREFGNVTLTEENSRLVWRWPLLENFLMDLRFALRMLVKNPGFTAVAATALALGIGADTAMYTIVNGALSWDLGLENRDRIVIVTSTNVTRSHDWGASYPDFRDFRSQTKSLSGLAAYQMAPVNLSDHNALPERYFCVQMSANGFSVVGHKPLLGRDFIPEDERPGAPPVLILGYHVWRDRYASDPSIIGKTVRMDEVPRVVIGVMPPGRRFPEETDLWTPLISDASREKRDNRDLMLFGNLGDTGSLAATRSEITALAAGLVAQYPDTNKDITADVRPIMEITGLYFMKPLFFALFGAVGCVLLIACADVANMLLARAAHRSREISIRVAIGAGKVSIIRQLLVESVVLSIAGGFLGWLVALGGLRWFDSGLGTQVKPIWRAPAIFIGVTSPLSRRHLHRHGYIVWSGTGAPAGENGCTRCAEGRRIWPGWQQIWFAPLEYSGGLPNGALCRTARGRRPDDSQRCQSIQRPHRREHRQRPDHAPQSSRS